MLNNKIRSLWKSCDFGFWLEEITAALGIGGAVGLIWAVSVRLTQWEAWSFILIIYHIFICSLFTLLFRFLPSRRGKKHSSSAPTLWAITLVLGFWLFAPFAPSVVGWIIRYASMFRFIS